MDQSIPLEDAHSSKEIVRALASRPYDEVIVLLDYDGTVVPIESRPEEATLDEPLFQQIEHLTRDERFKITWVSGRPRQFLESSLKHLRVAIAAEHGLVFRHHGTDLWHVFTEHSTSRTLANVRQSLMEFASEHTGSFIEEKEFSFAWHYRLCEEPIEQDLKRYYAQLRSFLPPDLDLLQSNKVIEIRPRGVTKGSFVKWYIEKCCLNKPRQLLLAIGDDISDEEMFANVNSAGGASVKVGAGETQALYRISTPESVLILLKELKDAILAP